MMHRSYRLSRLARPAMFYGLGLRPILRQFGARALHRLAPSVRVAHRRRRIDSSTPPLGDVGSELRTQLLDRHQRLRPTAEGRIT